MLRGGGDLATGVAWRLTRASWPVIVLELPRPLTVRRTVALSAAVTEGETVVQGLRGIRTGSPDEAVATARTGAVAVLAEPEMAPVGADVVVDARMAKRNLGTAIDDADLVVALGPGFTAGVDCHAVVETMRGHDLGRVIWAGSAAADTGTPGPVGGRSAERVLRAPAAGTVAWEAAIGDRVAAGQRLATVAEAVVNAPFDGVLRGAIGPGVEVRAGLKIGDVDPRSDPAACHRISDKALAVGGGVLEAVLAWRSGRAG